MSVGPPGELNPTDRRNRRSLSGLCRSALSIVVDFACQTISECKSVLHSLYCFRLCWRERGNYCSKRNKVGIAVLRVLMEIPKNSRSVIQKFLAIHENDVPASSSAGPFGYPRLCCLPPTKTYLQYFLMRLLSIGLDQHSTHSCCGSFISISSRRGNGDPERILMKISSALEEDFRKS
jgi:hypothetical protein